MKKVGIITFHASHNYGSMLQAYALQQVILNMGYQCEIINFRTERQKRFYQPFWRDSRWRLKIKAMLYPRIAWEDIRKHQLFEQFLSDKLILSKREFKTCEELKESGLDYDAYISGSDQIWNTICFDFDTVYYLNFVNKGCKIAYSPSMGPMPFQTMDKNLYPQISNWLNTYDSISVREQATAQIIKEITGVNPAVTVDPTLLLGSEEWNRLVTPQPFVKGKYILVYSPWINQELCNEALTIADKLDMPIICTTHDSFRRYHHNPRFKFCLDVGPLEFLNLIKNATMVVSASFHAVVFSIIFGVPFYAFNGMADARIFNLLTAIGLEKLAIWQSNVDLKSDAEVIRQGYKRIANYQQSSLNFLYYSLLNIK